MKKLKVAFDVDGTLRCNCTDTCSDPNARVVELFNMLASFKNTDMYVWSGGGAGYAYQYARIFGLKISPNKCIGKIGAPKMDIAIDDQQEFALADKNLIVRMK